MTTVPFYHPIISLSVFMIFTCFTDISVVLFLFKLFWHRMNINNTINTILVFNTFDILHFFVYQRAKWKLWIHIYHVFRKILSVYCD